jgi:diguanylate cyclase (GGDEF)-like protein
VNSFFCLLCNIFIFVLISSPSHSWASSGTLATPTTNYSVDMLDPVSIGPNMLHLKDPEHLENIVSILLNDSREKDSILSNLARNTPKNLLNWEKIKRSSPNFGFTNTAYWFKFNLNNTSNNDLKIYVELPIPFLDDIELYQTRNFQIQAQHLVGDRYPFSARPIQHENFVMPFTLLPGENLMYLRIASAGTVEAPLIIWQPEPHARATADEHFLQGMWAGIIGIMVIYNLLLFFSIKDINYLYYVFFSFGYLFFQLSLKGYGFAYIWPNQLDWNSFSISTFIALSNLSVLMLMISFLKLKEKNPIAYKVMFVVAFISGILLLLTFLIPYSFTIRLTSAITMITCSMSLILGYISLFKGDPDARYFCLAWTATFIGVTALAAVKIGLIPSNFWTSNAGQIGVIFLVSFLSFALANRFNREKELRISAQNASIESEIVVRQSQEEILQAKIFANDQLELKVEERTKTMQKALIELENANSRLELASTTDALTTLFNRGHFENRLDVEFKRAARHNRELSAIICDVDHFKNVNDTYGHKVGDDCLRSVALTLKHKITRSGDLIARFGGEEFIILLVDTPLQDAISIAQSLCDAIRHTDLLSNHQQITLTASFGVASLTQADIESAEALIHNADIALYQSKNNGRDQVTAWEPSNKS